MEHIVFVEASTTGVGIKGIENAKEKGMYVTFLTSDKKEYHGKVEVAGSTPAGGTSIYKS